VGTAESYDLSVDLGPSEVIIILVVILLLFGGAKLPQLARSLGQAKSEFEKATRGDTSTGDAQPLPADGAASETPPDTVSGSA
jgi:sec-independent protein translocase protein TatA